MSHTKTGRRHAFQGDISETGRDGQGTRASFDRLIDGSQQVEAFAEMASHVTHAASIIQLACQDISLADEVERAMAFAQVAEGRLQVDQDVD
jgi:hypothetical protein